MKKILLTVCFLIGSSVLSGASGKEDRVQVVINHIEVLAKLAHEEAPHQGNEDYKRSVGEKVGPLLISLSPEELGKIAVISWVLYNPGDAEDVGYDEVYYAAFWRCIDLLSKNADKESYYALLFVQAHSSLGAGEKLQFKCVMEEFEKRNKGKY